MSESKAAARTVDVVGPPDGAPIVLVHGTVFNRTMWAPQREALADEYRVVVPDLPGHGSRRSEPFELEAGVAAVEDAVEEHADGPVHLLGLSLGGYVATEYASRHPEDVEDLVLSGSSANPVGLLGKLSKLTGGAALLASKSDLVERGVDRVASWWVRRRDLDREYVQEIVASGFDLRPFGQGGLEIADHDFRSALAAYGGPVLLLNGKWDLLMRSGERDHAGAAADARIATIPGAGHTCNLERARDYEAVVRQFVSDEL